MLGQKQEYKIEEPKLVQSKLEMKLLKRKAEHQEAFDALKQALVTAPVWGYPDFSKEFILEMDVSLKWLGAILSQCGEDGKSHIIAYASRSL